MTTLEQRLASHEIRRDHLERQVADLSKLMREVTRRLSDLCVEVQVTRARMLTSAAITAFLLTTGLTVIALLLR